MKDKMCVTCKRFRRSSFVSRICQWLYQVIKDKQYIKFRGRCQYCASDTITVFEDNVGCVHYWDKNDTNE